MDTPVDVIYEYLARVCLDRGIPVLEKKGALTALWFEPTEDVYTPNIIYLNKDSTKLERTVALAHELGHCIDFWYDPKMRTSYEEAFACVGGFTNIEVYRRESMAWEYARRILQEWDVFHGKFREAFLATRKLSLRLYANHYRSGIKRRYLGLPLGENYQFYHADNERNREALAANGPS